jgi:hypothetical protein
MLAKGTKVKVTLLNSTSSSEARQARGLFASEEYVGELMMDLEVGNQLLLTDGLKTSTIKGISKFLTEKGTVFRVRTQNSEYQLTIC